MQALDTTDAFVGIALSAAYADGVMEMEEDERIADALAQLPCLHAITEDGMQAALRRMDAVAAEKGERAMLADACAAVPAALRETAFYLGADIVLADGVLETEERVFLDALRKELGISPAVADTVIDVVCIKNRA